MKPILFALILSLYSISSFCSVLTVTNTSDTGSGSLRQTINLAQADDTVRFDPNLIANGSDSIVLSTEIQFSKNLTIIGLYNASDSLFISGGQDSRIFSVSWVYHLTLDSLVLLNGFSNQNGGALLIEFSSNVFITNSFIKENRSNAGGGGLCFKETKNIHLNSNDITDNVAYYSGAIGSYSSDTLKPILVRFEMANCNVLRNICIPPNGATGGGTGGVYLSSIASVININNSNISNNQGYRGGGFSAVDFETIDFLGSDSSEINIRNSFFEHNRSHSGAAGCNYTRFAYDSNRNIDIQIDSSIFFNNHGVTAGGAIGIRGVVGFGSNRMVDPSVIKLHDVVLDSNGGKGGGAIFCAINGDIELEVTSSSVIRNKAYNNGAGIQLIADSIKLNVDNSHLDQNFANWSGGAIYIFGDYFEGTISNSTINKNNSGNFGAGVHVSCPKGILYDMDKVTCYDNNATQGGAVFRFHNYQNVVGDMVTKINRCTFYDNSSNFGSMISMLGKDSVSLDISNCTIFKNHSRHGNLVETYSNSLNGTIWVSNSIWTNNTVTFSNVSSPFSIVSKGYNLFGSSNVIGTHALDSLNVDTNLLSFYPFQHNGGFGRTLIPKSNTIAINSGNPLDTTEAQNSRIVGIRDVGAAEACAIWLSDTVSSCFSYVWRDGLLYDSSNAHANYIEMNPNGCDTVFQLNLTIDTVNTGVQKQGNSFTALATNAKYKWFDCNTGIHQLKDTNSLFTPGTSGFYAVEITQNGCVDTTKCTSIQIVGNAEVLYGSSIRVFPNPAKNQVRLQFDSNLEMGQVYIYSVDGRLKKQVVILPNQNEVLLNVESWKRGVYIIRLENDGKVTVKRLILN